MFHWFQNKMEQRPPQAQNSRRHQAAEPDKMEQQPSHAQQQELRNAEELKLAIGLSELLELGFTDDNLNTELLKKYNYNMELVIIELLEINQIQQKRKSDSVVESQEFKRIKKSLTSPGEGQRQIQPVSSHNSFSMYPKPIPNGSLNIKGRIFKSLPPRSLIPLENSNSTLAEEETLTPQEISPTVKTLSGEIIDSSEESSSSLEENEIRIGSEERRNSLKNIQETQNAQGVEASSTSTEATVGHAPIESQTLHNERQTQNTSASEDQPLDLEIEGNLIQQLRTFFESDASNNDIDIENNVEKAEDAAPEPDVIVNENIPMEEEFPDFADLECPICFEEYDSTTCIKMNPDPCGHHICEGCYKALEVSGQTNSGTIGKFYQCPVCTRTNGIKTGSGPVGTMTIGESIGRNSWIRIVYRIPSYPRYVADLPNSDEGQEVAQLLRQAFEHRLTFSVVTNNPTSAPRSSLGQPISNELRANIEHKRRNDYPDPDYLKRVKAQLKEFGIQ